MKYRNKMVVPSRKREMVKRLNYNLKAMKKELSDDERKRMKEKEKPIDEEEHKKRIELLKKIGVLKC